MKKKYITTIEDLLALKDTDTKMYADGVNGYYQFKQGILCYFYDDDSMIIFSDIGIGKGFTPRYIFEEEPVKEADENDIGKLCDFWDGNSKGRCISVLEGTQNNSNYRYKAKYGANWEHCRRLTPAEVAEITGYKVEE